MRARRSFRAPAAIALVALLGSCATTRLPPISIAGADFEPLRDERRLWERSRDEEAELRDTLPLYADPLLVDYLEEVASRLNPPAMAARNRSAADRFAAKYRST